MRLIERSLKARSDRPVLIRFDAWKYEKEGSLWRAMALCVLDALRRRLPGGGGRSTQGRGAPDAATGDRSPDAEVDRLQQSLYRDVDWQEKGKLTVDWPHVLKGTTGTALK